MSVFTSTRKFFNNFLNAYTLVKGGYDSIFLRNREYTLFDDDVTAKPYSKNELVYTCITTTMRNIAQVPMVVERWMRDDIWEPVPINNPWQKLIYRPNPYCLLDEFSFKEVMIGHLMIDGEVHAVKYPYRAKVPEYLQIIPKKYMKEVKNENTNQLIGWEYLPSLTQKGIPLNIDEVASVWFFNPDNAFRGLSPLEAAKVGLNTDYKAGRWNQNFFDNDASPGGVLEADKRLLPNTIDNLRAQFEARHQGYNRSHRLAVLDQGLKFKPISLTHHDMQFLDLRKFTHQQIMRVLGMKQAVLNSEGLNYAVAKQERKEWWMGTNLPIMRLLSSALTFALFGVEGKFRVRFRTETIEALQEDHLTKARTSHYLFRQGVPFNFINRRLEMGLPDIPGGDIGYLPKSMIPITMLAEVNQPKPAEPDTEPDPDDGDGDGDDDKMLLLPDPYESQYREYMNRFFPLIQELSKKLSKVLFDLRSEIIKRGNLDKKHSKSIEYLNKNTPLILEKASLPFSNISKQLYTNIRHMRYDLIFLNEAVKMAQVLVTNNASGDETRNLFNTLANKAEQIAYLQIMSIANHLHNIEISENYKSKIWYAPKSCIRHMYSHNQTKQASASWSSGLRFPCDPEADPLHIINCQCIEIGIN